MPKVKNITSHPDFAKLEETVLAFWKKNKSFEKSVEIRDEKNSYVFYDGPPFATGLPHYGHILASTTKDVIPRYWTMKGYRVERKWGWDCHGLPIENIIEKELTLETKKDIQEYGVGKFNEACRSRVLTYRDEWKKIIERMGRWVDMEDDYKTMEPEYMESLWWVFKALWERDLIYQGHKSMHICPRCSTPLSNFEVSLGYQDIKDISVYVQFRLDDKSRNKLLDELSKNFTTSKATAKNIYFIAWTTTPWTLPGNVLLAIDPKSEYIALKEKETKNVYIVQRESTKSDSVIHSKLEEGSLEIYGRIESERLPKLKLIYEPLFPYFEKTENAFRVVSADFVTMEEGTGIVHIAPGFGEDDYKLGERENIPLLQHVNMDGEFVSKVKDFAGMLVKPRGDHQKTDIEIIKYLAHNNKLFAKKKIKHSYPHCWRCDTPLLNYATESWFVKVTAFKDQLLKNNKKINWVPDHIKHGRFGNWLENVRDWAISRNRYWGTPLPVWKSEDGDILCIGSKEELEELSGQKVDDLHKHIIDNITITKDGKTYRRIPEVLDCWYESGSMPYASFHYPFDNKEKFETNFPAEFISEGIDQTRGWFYTLHVLATALTLGDNPAIDIGKKTSSFKNVIVNGVVLAEDGKKMSKRLKNYPDPMEIVRKYGVDSLRLYLMSSSIMKAENLNFSEKEVSDIRRKVFVIWWNMFSFYKMFAQKKIFDLNETPQSDFVMDRWVLSRLVSVTQNVTQYMDEYDVVKASRMLMEFVQEISTWYVRRSRDKIRSKNKQTLQTYWYVLVRLTQLFAPFAPFFSETMWHNLVDESESVHHSNWPKLNTTLRDEGLEKQMSEIRNVVESAHALRRERGVKVRQPLSYVKVKSQQQKPATDVLKILKEEINVKDVAWKQSKDFAVELDFELTEELKAEGEARELIRSIQQLRKKAKLTPSDEVDVQISSWPKQWKDEIKKTTRTKNLIKGDELKLVLDK